MPRVPTVFAFPGIALDHLVASLEARESHIRDRVLLMVSLLGGNDRSKGGKREVDTGETRYLVVNKLTAKIYT